MTLTTDMAWEAMAASEGTRGVPLLRSGCRRNAERVRHRARAASTAGAYKCQLDLRVSFLLCSMGRQERD